MIQRIQTVWWLASAVVLSSIFFLPLFPVVDANFMVANCKALMITAAVSIALSIAIIFLYSNRKLQMKIGYALILLHLIMLVFIGAHYMIDSGTRVLPGAGLPVVSLIFQFLAIHGVKKDEALIKSMDRLR